MEVLNRKLPIGIQTFEKIRREGYLYVDKTKFVWEMVSTSTPYFLSRPRRFGKSLLVSTLEAYFLGNALKAKAFGSYWFQTGTPTFLVELLKESDYDLRTLINGVEASASSFSEYRAEANNPMPLIYQSGYLTIKEYNKRFRNYLLQFPNDEVKYGFLNFLVE